MRQIRTLKTLREQGRNSLTGNTSLVAKWEIFHPSKFQNCIHGAESFISGPILQLASTNCLSCYLQALNLKYNSGIYLIMILESPNAEADVKNLPSCLFCLHINNRGCGAEPYS